VDDLLERPRESSKTRAAKIRLLDILEGCEQIESDSLVAHVVAATRLSANGVKKAKVELGHAGLIRSWQERSLQRVGARPPPGSHLEAQ
jgi:hypothetical protein